MSEPRSVLAQFDAPNAEEFATDPILAVACVLLIVVSIGWIVVARLVARNLRRAAARRIEGPRLGEVKEPRDIWSSPP